MYKLFKPTGYDANVSIENTDTLASIIIGKINSDVIKILTDAGHTHFPGTSEEWNFEISQDTAKALSLRALNMKKPIRDQRKVVTTKKDNKEIDAMDVLLGLASYN
jgi:hypothetical protein